MTNSLSDDYHKYLADAIGTPFARLTLKNQKIFMQRFITDHQIDWLKFVEFVSKREWTSQQITAPDHMLDYS